MIGLVKSIEASTHLQSNLQSATKGWESWPRSSRCALSEMANGLNAASRCTKRINKIAVQAFWTPSERVRWLCVDVCVQGLFLWDLFCLKGSGNQKDLNLSIEIGAPSWPLSKPNRSVEVLLRKTCRSGVPFKERITLTNLAKNPRSVSLAIHCIKYRQILYYKSLNL